MVSVDNNRTVVTGLYLVKFDRGRIGPIILAELDIQI